MDPNLLEKSTTFNLDNFIKQYENKIDMENKSVEVNLTYNNLTTDEIFNKILPEDQLFSGYTQIGHIIHVTLKEPLLDYKYLIGL